MTVIPVSHDHSVAKWRDGQACVRIIEEDLSTFQFLAKRSEVLRSHHQIIAHHHRHLSLDSHLRSYLFMTQTKLTSVVKKQSYFYHHQP
jgi:hypothetical protein